MEVNVLLQRKDENLANRMQRKKKVIFLHIPKNGGTTFRKYLAKQYKPEESYFLKLQRKAGNGSYYYDMDGFYRHFESNRVETKCVSGHLKFGIHEDLPGKWDYVTFVRHPVERVVSFYKYVSARPYHPYFSKLKSYSSFEGFVNGTTRRDIHNAQIRIVSGLRDGEEQEMLEKAVENVANFFPVVGVLGRFEDSVILMQKEFGWDLSSYKIRNKSSKNNILLTSDIRKKIEKLNKGDLIFYEHLKNRLNAQVKEMGGAMMEYKRLCLRAKCLIKVF